MKMCAQQQRQAAIIAEIRQSETTAGAANRDLESREPERFGAPTAELETLGKRINFAAMTNDAERPAQPDTVTTVCKFEASMARNPVAAMP